MNPRERFLNTLNGKPTDRPPLYVSMVPQLAKRLSDHLGVPYEEPVSSLLGSRISFNNMLVGMGVDAIGVAACFPDNNLPVTREDGITINEWGIGTKPHGLYDDFAIHPLANVQTVEEIENYPFPEVDAPGRFRFAEETIAKYGKMHGIIGDLECAIYEISWYMVGLEKLLMDMMLEEPYVDALLDKVTDIATKTGLRLIEAGVDMIWAGDDFGSQNSLIMSPEMFDRYFAPRIKKMFDAFKTANPNIKLAWHTCGSVVPLVPKFIELGLDFLNPLQPMAKDMDAENMSNLFKGKINFFGAICVQDVLPNGTPESIKAEIKRVAGILGKGGGYILAPAHNIQDDTSVENVLALFEAVENLDNIY
jgi:uroporphyrinogen decarboxylase